MPPRPIFARSSNSPIVLRGEAGPEAVSPPSSAWLIAAHASTCAASSGAPKRRSRRFALFGAGFAGLERSAARVRKVPGAPRAPPLAQEEELARLGLVESERVKGAQRHSHGPRRSILEINALGQDPRRRFRLREFERLETPRGLSQELVALYQPASSRLAAHFADVDKLPAEEHVQAAEELRHAGKERLAHPLVEVAPALAGRAVSELAVPVAHEPLEELAHADRASRAAPLAEGVPQHGIEPCRPRQVVAGSPQDQLARRQEAPVPALGKHREKFPRELPPVAQRRARQVLQPFRQFRLAEAPLGEGCDRGGAEELERRFPEVVGRLVALERGLRVQGASAELSEGKRQLTRQVLIARVVAHRVSSIEWCP